MLNVRQAIAALEALAAEHGDNAFPVLEDSTGTQFGFVASFDDVDSDNYLLQVASGTDCGR